MTPQRIQLRRRRGWRKPAGAIVVARPSRWGNPFRVWYHNGWQACWYRREQRLLVPFPVLCRDEPDARAVAVDAYRHAMRDGWEGLPTADDIREHLAGHDLACWCPDDVCHATVLLAVANGLDLP